MRRVHTSGIKAEAVTAEAGRTPDIISSARRPVVAGDASVPESSATNTGQTYVPAAHEAFKILQKVEGRDITDTLAFFQKRQG